MPVFLQQVAAADHRLLWLDDTDYSSALLAGGHAPWLDTSAYIAWRRKAQGLLKSGVVALPVAQVCEALIAGDSQMRAAMGAKSRATFPLRTLLSSSALRPQVADMLVGLRSSFPSLPLALVCPSPRAWLADAHHAAFPDAAPIEVGEEEVDSATVLCADFLREFATTGVDTVLLEESQISEPQNASEVEWYRAVFNVASHYRWAVGLRIPGRRFSGDHLVDCSYVIAPQPSGECRGQIIGADFWRGAAPEASSRLDFRFVHIPAGLQPEVVLDRLATLR